MYINFASSILRPNESTIKIRLKMESCFNYGSSHNQCNFYAYWSKSRFPC